MHVLTVLIVNGMLGAFAALASWAGIEVVCRTRERRWSATLPLVVGVVLAVTAAWIETRPDVSITLRLLVTNAAVFLVAAFLPSSFVTRLIVISTRPWERFSIRGYCRLVFWAAIVFVLVRHVLVRQDLTLEEEHRVAFGALVLLKTTAMQAIITTYVVLHATRVQPPGCWIYISPAVVILALFVLVCQPLAVVIDGILLAWLVRVTHLDDALRRVAEQHRSA